MTKSIYVGIDPSFTNTGIVVIDGDKVYSHEYSLPKLGKTAEHEALRLFNGPYYANKWIHLDSILGTIPMWRNARVGIEMPMGGFGRKFHSPGLDRLFGYWLGYLDWRSGAPEIFVYTPSQIKLFFTGSGNCHCGRAGSKEQKEMMVWFANNVWDFKTDSHDIADAFAIAKLTQYIDEGKYEL